MKLCSHARPGMRLATATVMRWTALLSLLVVSFIATVGNYEYGFYWYLYQDASIQFEIKLTGIMHTGALPPGEKRPYGRLVAPQLYAPIHQHMFNVRLDMMVDGVNNSIYESHNEIEPLSSGNPHVVAQYDVACFQQTQH